VDRKIIGGYRYGQENQTFLCMITNIISLAHESNISFKDKTYNFHYHFVWKKVREIEAHHCLTREMVVEILTKAFPRGKMVYHGGQLELAKI